MAIYRKYKDLAHKPDMEIQLIATELDTSASDLYAISGEHITDALAHKSFNDLFQSIIMAGDHITSFDDNTDMYEWNDGVLITHVYLGHRMIVCERDIAVALEEHIYKYK